MSYMYRGIGACVQSEMSETAARGLDSKQSRYHEPPTPWSQSSADAVPSQRRVHDVHAHPPSVPPGKRAQLSDSDSQYSSSSSLLFSIVCVFPPLVTSSFFHDHLVYS